jgi:hypothetical protein
MGCESKAGREKLKGCWRWKIPETSRVGGIEEVNVEKESEFATGRPGIRKNSGSVAEGPKCRDKSDRRGLHRPEIGAAQPSNWWLTGLTGNQGQIRKKEITLSLD